MDTKDIILLVDGDHQTTLKEFLHTNTAPDVDMPSPEELEAVCSLGIGESVFIGLMLIRRIK